MPTSHVQAWGSFNTGESYTQEAESIPPSHSNSVLDRSASNIIGFTSSGQGDLNHGNVTRQNLIDQGHTPVQADARLVRMHEDQVLWHSFRNCFICFSLLLCILAPTMLAIMIWTVVEYFSSWHAKCDVPLQTWVQVVCIIVIFNMTLNRFRPGGSFIHRVVCRWRPDPNDTTRSRAMPLRVQLYNCSVTLFTFVWNSLGIYWVIVDGKSGDTPCSEAAPGLYTSVKVYAAINLASTIFFYLNMIGFAQLLRVAMRRGLLHTNNAAPQGALEKNTDVVMNTNSEVFGEQPQCSICLEEFGFGPGKALILKTKGCDHIFHKPCLQGWLKVNRTCPLCRRDLGEMTEP